MKTLTSICLFPMINLEPSTTLCELIVVLPRILPSKFYHIKSINKQSLNNNMSMQLFKDL